METNIVFNEISTPTFSYTMNFFNKKQEINLKEDGYEIYVDDKNKRDYVKMISKTFMTDNIHK